MSTSSPVYVLDTNVFVQAHRRHYAFDICPGFWDCLIYHHETGRIVSIDRVRDEILAGDALETWAKDSAPPSLFAATADAAVVQNYKDMVRWVNANSTQRLRQILHTSPMRGFVHMRKQRHSTSS
jgi:hypothetical protein